ncbi:laminin subunit alpha-like [Drosophila rhopaloa]|uniref:Laminin subunit alpha-like n=1 Tax=Drosophila rhopaloa TaxID=1041015 RepID=A0A6P4FSE8_DRORH|nr:laminin subunit alpha-like [Drosophila rhopaloa]
MRLMFAVPANLTSFTPPDTARRKLETVSAVPHSSPRAVNGTNGYHCEAESGQQCPCKINFAGVYCKQCKCNKIGSISNECNVTTGECKCLTNFGGDNCERCKHGYFNYPTCSYCDCVNQGCSSPCTARAPMPSSSWWITPCTRPI